MLVAGEWFLCDDGTSRPTVRAKVQGAEGILYIDRFLLDVGADTTVFSANLLHKLGLPVQLPTSGLSLQGISGDSPFVLLTTVMEFTRDDGGPTHVRGEFAAFTDPAATDLSILGRDVLNNFDLIVSRRRNEILLLAPNHHYHVMRT